MLREEREVLNVINAIETIYNEVVESDDEYSKDYEKFLNEWEKLLEE